MSQLRDEILEKGMHLMDFGIPEPMGHARVENFLATVTIHAHGDSLHANVEAETGE